MTLTELKEKRENHIVTSIRMQHRINDQICKAGVFRNIPEREKISKHYDNAHRILSGKINSLDFVICSIEKGVKHDQDIWDFEFNRALS